MSGSAEDNDIDLDLLDYLQTLTPAQRLERHDAALQLVLALRKAGTEHYGFDPRAVVEATELDPPRADARMFSFSAAERSRWIKDLERANDAGAVPRETDAGDHREPDALGDPKPEQ